VSLSLSQTMRESSSATFDIDDGISLARLRAATRCSTSPRRSQAIHKNRANDGFAWSAWKEFHVSAPVDHAPVVTASDFNATLNQTVAAASLFSVADADNDSIAKYQFWESTANASSGHWSVGGVAQGTNTAIDVTAAQLASTTFQGGSVPDALWVRANDGIQWSQWQEFHWIGSFKSKALG